MKITTHVLDTSKGWPAEGISVTLYRLPGGQWAEMEMARGRTNKDGRINDWLALNAAPENGIYIMRFEIKPYFERQSVTSFYPIVEIHFEITRDGHYHIPLLISPFGYSTYRGS